MKKPLIKDFNKSELSELLVDMGFKRYRADQVYNQLFSQRITDFSKMKTLPNDLRTKLSETFQISSFADHSVQESKDGTLKFLFTLLDEKQIESVMIPGKRDSAKEKFTLCISSQVGCGLDCSFCATGKLGFQRNLSSSEIVDQYFEAERISGKKISNIVFMGMGEPLMNLKNVISAIEVFTNPELEPFSRKRITVSTVGLADKIEELAKTKLGVKLAISLHSTDPETRNKLIPVSKKNDLKAIEEAAVIYQKESRLPITIEYVLFKGINDSKEEIRGLAKLSRKFQLKVNLIAYHPIDFTNPSGFASDLKPASQESINFFQEQLRQSGLEVFKRFSSGLDISAACGQLAFANKDD